MATKLVHLTKEGYAKMKAELEHLRSVERSSITAQIAEARDKGDLSENAEYDAAKEAQGMLEMKIAKLEAIFSAARVIDSSKLDIKTVQILNRVTLQNHTTNKEMIYTIVSESEASIKDGKLSVGTPIAKAILGKKKGDIVEVTVPSGKMNLEILDISI